MTCPRCNGPIADMRDTAYNPKQQKQCYIFDSRTFTCLNRSILLDSVAPPQQFRNQADGSWDAKGSPVEEEGVNAS